MYEDILQKSLNFNQELIHKFGCLLECESIDQSLSIGPLLLEPLIPDHCSSPNHCRLSSRQIDLVLLNEWKSMLTLVNALNEDRKNLQTLSINLLKIISQGEISRQPFENFITKTQHVHYQLLKKFLEKERIKNESLIKEIEILKPCEKKESAVQTDRDEYVRSSISNLSEINFKLDFSMASDTTTSPLNISIDTLRSSNLMQNAITDRGIKKNNSKISTISNKNIVKKNTEETAKQLPVLRKNVLRRATKN